ncbi:MAG: FAD-dependent oxidoreductase, partial [Aquiluna sp.]
HSVVMPDDPADLYRALKSNSSPNQTMSFVNYYEPGHIYSNKKATVAVLLTAPADSADYDLETPWVRDELDRVSNLIGLDRPIDEMFEDYKVLNANYFEGFGALGGALYGAKNPLWQSGPFHNPSYRSLTKPWLYRVGASVHPGGGIPAVMGGAMNSISSLI